MAKRVSFDLPESEWQMRRKDIDLERQQIIARELAKLQQPLKGEMVSGHFVGPSWTQHLARGVESWLGKKDRDMLSKKQSGVTEEEQQDLLSTVQRYFKAIEGTPGTPDRQEMVEGKMVDPEVYWKPEPAQTFGLEENAAPVNPGMQVEMEGQPGALQDDVVENTGMALASELRGPMADSPNIDYREYTQPPVQPPSFAGTLQQGQVPMSPQGRPAPPQMPPMASRPPMVPRTVPGQPATPGNPREAMMIALASKHPMMQQLAMEQMLAQSGAGKPDLEAFMKASAYLDPASLVHIGAPESFKQLVKRNDISSLAQGAAPVSKTTGEILPTAQGRFEAPFQRGKDWYQRDAATGMERKLDNAPQVSMSMQPEPTYLRERAGALAKDVTAAQNAAASAQSMLVNLDYLDQLNAKTDTAGPLAEFGMLVNGLANQMGFAIDQERLATDETYRSVVNRQIVDTFMNAVGGAHGFTEMETKMLAQSYPQINMNKKARETVIGIMRAKMKRDIDVASKVLEQESANFPELGRIPKVTGVSSAPPAQRGALDPNTPMTAEEQAELDALRRKYGR